MTPETALWIAGISLPALLVWCIYITMKLKTIGEDSDTLVMMHKSPDKYGFGTIATNKSLTDNTNAVRELTHYIKWFIHNATGNEPPPPLDGL